VQLGAHLARDRGIEGGPPSGTTLQRPRARARARPEGAAAASRGRPRALADRRGEETEGCRVMPGCGPPAERAGPHLGEPFAQLVGEAGEPVVEEVPGDADPLGVGQPVGLALLPIEVAAVAEQPRQRLGVGPGSRNSGGRCSAKTSSCGSPRRMRSAGGRGAPREGPRPRRVPRGPARSAPSGSGSATRGLPGPDPGARLPPTAGGRPSQPRARGAVRRAR